MPFLYVLFFSSYGIWLPWNSTHLPGVFFSCTWNSFFSFGSILWTLTVLSFPTTRNWWASLFAVSIFMVISKALGKVRSFSESHLRWHASFFFPTHETIPQWEVLVDTKVTTGRNPFHRLVVLLITSINNFSATNVGLGSKCSFNIVKISSNVFSLG